MPSDGRQLPIFPLNTVLFPGASLPLQVFEERYKLMMEHCLDGDSKFGVVLIMSGSEVGEPAGPHQTGTLAQIVQVNRVRGDRMFISVTGRQRFAIKDITQRRPYIVAEVELFEEEADAPVPPSEMEAVRVALTLYYRRLLGLRGGWVRRVRMPSDPLALSYFIAGLLQVGSKEKQELLEEPSASKRLEAELELLRRESERLGQRVAAELRKGFSRQ
jgi:Lon protease-like protein